MTVSEAIERIDEVLDSEYYYDETLGYQLTSDDFEWLEKAKQALEKQIPKKLKETEAYPHRLYCPECYFTLVFNKDNADFIKSNQTYNFCPACGQALDWSDKE